MHSGIVNKIKYDDAGKPIKQTSFIVKNLGRNFPKKKSTIIKKSFRSNTKPLSLHSINSINELTVETFHHFKTSKLSNL